MQDNPQTTANISQDVSIPDREALFEIYRVWKSLPVLALKGVTRESLFQQAGIDDPIINEIVGIKTQGDFADRYDIHITTLTRWNKKIDEMDPLIEAKGWGRKLAKNMVMALYAHAVRKGDPALFKLFFQVVNEWSEKSTVEHDFVNVTEFNISIAQPKNAPIQNKTDGNKDQLGNDAQASPSVPVPTGPGN